MGRGLYTPLNPGIDPNHQIWGVERSWFHRSLGMSSGGNSPHHKNQTTDEWRHGCKSLGEAQGPMVSGVRCVLVGVCSWLGMAPRDRTIDN
jgi:hypothetical protein